MARSSASIQSEITALETYLTSANSFVSSAGSDGTTLSQADRDKLSRRLDELYAQLDRVTGNAPMFVRGRIKGL